MSRYDRRTFMGASVGAAAAGIAAGRGVGPSLVHAAEAAAETAGDSADVPPPPQIELGKTGVKMTRLGQGTGVHGGDRQSDQTRMGFAMLVELMQHAYDRGIRFFDLADLYGTHVYFREALKSMERDKLAILTKVWWRYDGPEDQTGQPARRQIAKSTIERFRHELATDYIDIVLLHCLMEPGWDEHMRPYMEALAEETAVSHGVTRRAVPDEEILERLTTALANEGARVLGEGFASRAGDIDVIYCTGFGFPRDRGGPMFYASTIGLPAVLAAVEKYRERVGPHWEPAPLLEQLVRDRQTFAGNRGSVTATLQ